MLSNLASTTIMHWNKFGKCFQHEVPDLHVNIALAKAGVAGTCSQDGFTKEDSEQTFKLPEFGNVTFSVWEEPSAL